MGMFLRRHAAERAAKDAAALEAVRIENEKSAAEDRELAGRLAAEAKAKAKADAQEELKRDAAERAAKASVAAAVPVRQTLHSVPAPARKAP